MGRKGKRLVWRDSYWRYFQPQYNMCMNFLTSANRCRYTAPSNQQKYYQVIRANRVFKSVVRTRAATLENRLQAFSNCTTRRVCQKVCRKHCIQTTWRMPVHFFLLRLVAENNTVQYRQAFQLGILSIPTLPTFQTQFDLGSDPFLITVRVYRLKHSNIRLSSCNRAARPLAPSHSP